MLVIAVATAVELSQPIVSPDSFVEAALTADSQSTPLDVCPTDDYFHMKGSELMIHPYRMTSTAFRCPPEFTFRCEMDLAATYALARPDLAAECATFAHDAALEARRPDLAYEANDLLAAIGAP